MQLPYRRFGQRNTAYQKALNSLEHWNHMKDLSKEYQNDMKNQIIMTALGDGFFSIWMEVFCDEPEIRLALIEAFPGTNLNYYDEKGCVKEIIYITDEICEIYYGTFLLCSEFTVGIQF